MSQNDLNIANQGFPSFRSDLNDALQALGSNSSGASSPATTYAGQFWYDSTNNVVKFRNEANSAWIDPPIAGLATSLSDFGVTASAAELNKMDGVLATTAEINYNDITTLGTVQASKTVTADASGNVLFPDGDRILMGNGSDLQIYHNGSLSVIEDSGTGSLQIKATNLEIRSSTTNENYIYCVENGAVTLYYNDAAKLATNSAGITVTGTINGGDLRGAAWIIGRDSNDYIAVDTNKIDFSLDDNIDMRLENDGDLHVDGNVIAYSTTISDERLKTDIVKIDGALDKVAQLNGYTFTYTADGKKSAGVIAQEVQKVLPSAIVESKLPLKMGEDDETEYMTVQYDQLMGLMIEAIKELKAEIAELKGK